MSSYDLLSIVIRNREAFVNRSIIKILQVITITNSGFRRLDLFTIRDYLFPRIFYVKFRISIPFRCNLKDILI